MALCAVVGKCSWSHTWDGAYEPTIQYMPRWSTERTNLFLVTYNQGAEAETAVVIGWSLDERPVIYDQRDGAWATVAPDNATVEVNTSSGTDVTLACFGWNETTMRLKSANCSWVPK